MGATLDRSLRNELQQDERACSVKTPEHVAVMMDGNRRWARQRELPLEKGHWMGAKVLIQIVKHAAAIGVRTITAYTFSTENWKRPSLEVNALMEIFEYYLVEIRDAMVENGVKLSTIGDISRFSSPIKEALEETKRITAQGDRLELVLALNYGARDDVRRGVLRVLDAIERGDISKDQLSEEVFSSYLDTAGIKDPDLLIRTSGEQRLSNFLLWQISYTEVYMTDVLWPDFTEEDFDFAIEEYKKRVRRRGE